MKTPQVVLLWVATMAVLFALFVGFGLPDRDGPPKPTFTDLVKVCQSHGGTKAAKSTRIEGKKNARKYTVTCRDNSVLYTTQGE